jgi:hypothetical protein
MNKYVDFGDAVHLVSPSGESLCIFGPDYIAEHPEIITIPWLDYEKQKKLAEIADARYKEEMGGLDAGAFHLATDDRSKTMLFGAYSKARDDPEFTTQWKDAEGAFHAVDAVTIITACNAMTDWVESLFAREAELSTQIKAAETVEEVQAVEYETA